MGGSSICGLEATKIIFSIICWFPIYYYNHWENESTLCKVFTTTCRHTIYLSIKNTKIRRVGRWTSAMNIVYCIISCVEFSLIFAYGMYRIKNVNKICNVFKCLVWGFFKMELCFCFYICFLRYIHSVNKSFD